MVAGVRQAIELADGLAAALRTDCRVPLLTGDPPIVPKTAAAPASASAERGASRVLPARVVGSLVLLLLAGVWLATVWRSPFDVVQQQLSSLRTRAAEQPALVMGMYAGGTALIAWAGAPWLPLLWMLGGALFDPLLGLAVGGISAAAGATVAMLTSRRLLRSVVVDRWGDHLSWLDRPTTRRGLLVLLGVRLIPHIPNGLINLVSGWTSVRWASYLGVSWLGMLPVAYGFAALGHELGFLDGPRRLWPPRMHLALTLLGVALLLGCWLWTLTPRTSRRVLTVGATVLLAAVGLRWWLRYRTADEMTIAVREYTNAEYPEDPSNRSIHCGKYNGRTLKLIRKDERHFDFVFESPHAHLARIAILNVDVSLMTPGLPEWTRQDSGLRRIALTDRQWNRQQVRFGGPAPGRVEVSGGDGFEASRLYSAELAKNCLNAGLWELQLFLQENGEKKIYYHGWFTFPLGHYGRLFTQGTDLPYWRHWYYLEHWVDPAGTPIALESLRKVTREAEAACTFEPSAPVIAAGEQIGKRRTTIAVAPAIQWQDFFDGRTMQFAAFIPPGRYSVKHPWGNAYKSLDQFQRAVVREIVSPADSESRTEIELEFRSSHGPGRRRFLVSGFRWSRLPQLPVAQYPAGLYMPMGIGVPPFFQDYSSLQQSPPERSPYFSLLLDDDDRWVDHHQAAIDGPVLHLDERDPNRLHLYLLSYERHTLIGHWVIERPFGN